MAIFVRIVLVGVMFVVLLAAIAVGAALFVDPNQFKSTITGLAEDATGLWLNLEGDLSWSVFPRMSIVSHDMQADWTPQPDAPFLSAGRLALGVELWPLLSTEPELRVKWVELAGLRLELQRDASGRGNWEAPPSSDAGTGADGSTGFDAWRFDRIAVTDAVVRYVDLAAGQTLMIHDMDLEASNVTLGEAFPLAIHLDFDLQNQATHVLMDIATDVTIDRTYTHVKLDAMNVDGELRRQGFQAVSYSMSGRMSSDAAKGTATVALDEFNFGTARLTMSAQASDLYEVPKLTGHLDLDVPDTSTLSSQLGIGEIPIERVALAMNYDIEGQAVNLSNIKLTLDETTLVGKLELTDEEIPNLNFELETDVLLLDRYLAAAEAQSSTATHPSDVLDTPFFDREMLPALHWRGRITAKKVLAGDLEFHGAELITRHRNGVVSNSLNIGSILEGRLKGNAALDATAEPRWSMKVAVDQIRAQAIYKWLGFDADIKGHFDVSGEFVAAGNTQMQLANSITGDVNIDGGHGSTSIAEIKDVGRSIAVLAGREKKVVKWPDVIDYQHLVGSAHLEGLQDQHLTFALDNFELRGQGGYDLANDTIDYKVTVVFRNKYDSFRVPDIFAGVAWPVRCTGRLDDESLCSLRKEAAASIITQLLTKQVARGLIKGIGGIITAPVKLIKKPEKKEPEK